GCQRSDCPWPGRSGATTRRDGDSRRTASIHTTDEDPAPCTQTRGGRLLSPSSRTRRLRLSLPAPTRSRLMPRVPYCRSAGGLELLDLFHERRDRLLPRRDQPVVGDLEDRRLRILVDG